MTLEIRALSFSDDGISVEFIDFTSDVRSNGLVLNRALFIPDNSAYHSDIDALRTRATFVLQGALDDWERSEPVTPADLREIDGPSPYDNPLERDLGGAS
jgi:hypothetical protein